MRQSDYLVTSGNLHPFANQVCQPAQEALEQDLTAALQNHECQLRRARPILTARRHGFIESRTSLRSVVAHRLCLHSVAGRHHLSDFNRKPARQSGSNRTFVRSSMISETSSSCSRVLPSNRAARRELQPSAELNALSSWSGDEPLQRSLSGLSIFSLIGVAMNSEGYLSRPWKTRVSRTLQLQQWPL